MSRRPKYSEQDFPPAGTVFAALTSDGRYSVGRVLRREVRYGSPAVLIAATPWLGREVPSIETEAIRATLHLTHHAWKNQPEVFWVYDLMPANFIIVGQIELSAEDLAAHSDTLAAWQSVPLQALLQWRWDHDRDALLQDEARQAAELEESRRKRAEARAEFMRTLTLDRLVDKAWFESWEESPADPRLQESRLLIANLVNPLRSAPKLTAAVVKKNLKQCVLEFNRLDAEHSFISTIEREDLCEAFEQIACAARFPQVIDQVERWREW